ncbi:hypothetical protein [Streptomyces sp. NPDC003393]
MLAKPAGDSRVRITVGIGQYARARCTRRNGAARERVNSSSNVLFTVPGHLERS